MSYYGKLASSDEEKYAHISAEEREPIN